ncbi:MAG: FAD:protein FMN transferase [Spirochaetes bacterium]|nr:FAD:protein FMN transferase [Spirochaetota bacterium]
MPFTRILAGLTLAGSIMTAASGCAADTRAVAYSRMGLLGTLCKITTWGPAEEAANAAFERILNIDEHMSANRAASEVSRINAAAGTAAVAVSADTFTVIREAVALSRLGDGRFDLTVGPLVNLWGIGTDDARVPAANEIAAARALVGWRDVALSEADSTVFLRRAGMAIDLGAIAKGYAADEAAAVLAAKGVRTALIDLGGNVLTLGAKPDGSPWRIGLQDPDPSVPRGTHIGIIEFEGSFSVVTSGTYERYFVRDGVRYHHLLDTATGMPVENGLVAVTIFTSRSMTADGYSTLVFASGLDRGRTLVERTDGAMEALFFTDRFEVYATSGIRSRLKLSDARWQLRDW